MNDVVTGQRFDVYEYVCENGSRCMFSKGVTREFGENKMITLTGGSKIMSSVQPLHNTIGCTLVGNIFKYNAN